MFLNVPFHLQAFSYCWSILYKHTLNSACWHLVMIDWEGLLKFSLKYSDGTKKSDFSQMKPENKKWLQEAIKSYSHSEIDRIQNILEELSKPEEQKEEYRLNLLEELQEILDSLDKSSTLYKMGGHIILLKIIFYSKFQSNRILALQIFASINQNDAHTQTESINTGALELVELILKEKQSMKLREAVIGAISALVRGENLEAKRIFIRIHGLETLTELLNEEKQQIKPSKRLTHKIFVLLRDLLLYDDRLHFTYNDLSSFSNTAHIQLGKDSNDKKERDNSLTYDKNKEVADKNELEQNKKYRGSVKKWLSDQKGIQEQYEIWLKQQQKEENL